MDVLMKHVGSRLANVTYRQLPAEPEGTDSEGEDHSVQVITSGQGRVGRRKRRRCKIITGIFVILIFFAALIGILTYVDSRKQSLPNPDEAQFRLSDAALLAPKPPMGWNSWNKFDCDGLNETVVNETAKLLVSKGLKDAGYVYVNLDDCWQWNRNSSGFIQPDPAKFPEGEQSMVRLGRHLHQMGLKFGIYTDRGSLTCQRRPGSYGHEEKDAQSYASWGVDLLKNDDCYIPPASKEEDQNAFDSYLKMRIALDKTGRNIIHSIKATMPIQEASTVSEMRRVGDDIWMSWSSMLNLIDVTTRENLQRYSGIGFWNDLDMLEVGNPGMSEDEQVAHFILWCAFKAPLILGNDLKHMNEFTLKLLKNKGLIAINQDPLGESVDRVWSQRLVSGSANTLVVSDSSCDGNSSDIWHFVTKDGKPTPLIQLVDESLCLSATPNDFSSKFPYVSVVPCDFNDSTQFWRYDSTKNLMYLLENADSDEKQCLTMAKSQNGYARVRPCDAKRKLYGNMYVTFDTALSMVTTKDGHFMLKNPRNSCMSASAMPELDYFGGKLSEGRFVAVLLNRDFKKRLMTLRWIHMKDLGIDLEGLYEVQNAFTEEILGNKAQSITVDVKPHYAVALVLKKANV